jgi:hypothetical protein
MDFQTHVDGMSAAEKQKLSGIMQKLGAQGGSRRSS